MASQTSVLQHTWSSRCYLAHSAIEAALANFGAGRASDLVPVEIYLREIVSLYDQSDGMDKDQLRAVALQVKDVSEALAAMITCVPEARNFLPLLEQLRTTGEDLADSSRLFDRPFPNLTSDDYYPWPFGE